MPAPAAPGAAAVAVGGLAADIPPFLAHLLGLQQAGEVAALAEALGLHIGHEAYVPGIYEQLQLLPEPVVPTPRTPHTLGTVTVWIHSRHNALVPLDLAQPPVDPATGRRAPLSFFSRYNSTWVEVAAGLVYRDGPGEAAGQGPAALGGHPGQPAAGGLPAQQQAAGAAGDSGSRGKPPQRVSLFLLAADPRIGRVDFLERVLELFRFRWACLLVYVGSNRCVCVTPAVHAWLMRHSWGQLPASTASGMYPLACQWGSYATRWLLGLQQCGVCSALHSLLQCCHIGCGGICMTYTSCCSQVCMCTYSAHASLRYEIPTSCRNLLTMQTW